MARRRGARFVANIIRREHCEELRAANLLNIKVVNGIGLPKSEARKSQKMQKKKASAVSMQRVADPVPVKQHHQEIREKCSEREANRRIYPWLNEAIRFYDLQVEIKDAWIITQDDNWILTYFPSRGTFDTQSLTEVPWIREKVLREIQRATAHRLSVLRKRRQREKSLAKWNRIAQRSGLTLTYSQPADDSHRIQVFAESSLLCHVEGTENGKFKVTVNGVESLIAEDFSKVVAFAATQSKLTPVAAGTSVRLGNCRSKSIETYVVTSDATPPSDSNWNQVRANSPFGSQLVGCRKGDHVTIRIPAGSLEFVVMDVQRLSK